MAAKSAPTLGGVLLLMAIVYGSYWLLNAGYRGVLSAIYGGGGILLEGPKVVTQSSSEVSLSEEDRRFVCRASIATLMSKQIESIEAVSTSDGMISTSYVRTDDNSIWKNVCSFDGNQVNWAWVENGQRGRWRNDPLDEKVSFTLTDGVVAVILSFGDGSELTKSFKRD